MQRDKQSQTLILLISSLCAYVTFVRLLGQYIRHCCVHSHWLSSQGGPMVYELETSLLSVIVSYESRQCYYVSAVKSVIDIQNTGGRSMKAWYLDSKVFLLFVTILSHQSYESKNPSFQIILGYMGWFIITKFFSSDSVSILLITRNSKVEILQ